MLNRRNMLAISGANCVLGCVAAPVSSVSEADTPIEIHPSPNYDARKFPVSMVILHYTGMQSFDLAVQRLSDPNAKVSAHYVVSETGRIVQLVSETDRAWHAGAGTWQGLEDINSRSIGIEIANPGHEWGYRPFPDAQMKSVIQLLKSCKSIYAIQSKHILGHSDMAPARKDDPGELFPWDMLSEQGLAVGSYKGEADPSITYEDALGYLSDIGYDVPAGAHIAPLLAFQRHFCPSQVGQSMTPLTKAALRWAASEMQ